MDPKINHHSANSVYTNNQAVIPSCLEMIGVTKTFKSTLLKKKQVVVNDLSCQFLKGHCTGLLGHNGAGKTTSIRLILGLIFPDSGQILFEGSPLTTKAKQLIGYMPETNKLPGVLTPEELLRQQLSLYQPARIRTTTMREAAIKQTLELVGLAEHRKKRAAHLSKGMARRLAWALATIHKPRLLILDEPASGLDPLGRQQMLQWIEAEKKSGTTILLCTHEMTQIQALCDELHILKQGRLVFSASRTANGASPATWRQSYQLHLSGVDEASLKQIGISAQLQAWSSLKTEGYLAILGFDDYAVAAAWLATCLNRGLLVLRFSDETLLDDAEFLSFFVPGA